MQAGSVSTYQYPLNYGLRAGQSAVTAQADTSSSGNFKAPAATSAGMQSFGGGANADMGMREMVQQLFNFFVTIMQSMGYSIPGQPGQPGQPGSPSADGTNGGQPTDGTQNDGVQGANGEHCHRSGEPGNAKETDNHPGTDDSDEAAERGETGETDRTRNGCCCCCCAPCCCPPTQKYEGGKDAKYWGDPHLVGFDGEQYDVMGENLGQEGRVYNMLSDRDIQYNTRFVQWGGDDASVIGEAGIQVGSSQVFFDRTGTAPTVNGQAMNVGQEYQLDGGTANWDGTRLMVSTREYNIDLRVSEPDHANGAYIDSNVSLNGDPFADRVTPHGLLGQTADGVAGHRRGDLGQDQGKQGGTVIDGTVGDYEVDNLWDNDFRYNRFGS